MTSEQHVGDELSLVEKLENSYVRLFTNYIEERFSGGETTADILYNLWLQSKSSRPELAEKLGDALETCSNVCWVVDDSGTRQYYMIDFLSKMINQ